jgi:integrase
MATITKRQRRTGTDISGRPLYGPAQGWRVRYVDPDGNEHSKQFARKADAEAFVTMIEHSKRTGAYVDPGLGKMTFKAYAEEWRAAQPHKPSTVEHVESRLRLHIYPAIGHRPLTSIRPTELQALIRSRSEILAPATLESVMVWMQIVFKAAVQDRILTVSPATGLRLPAAADRDPVQPLEMAQVEAIADAMPDRWRAIVALGVGTGMREGELLGLLTDRVDWLPKLVRVDRQLVRLSGRAPFLAIPKTKASNRTIPLPDVVIEELARHLATFPAEAIGYPDLDGRPTKAGFVFTNDGSGAGDSVPCRSSRFHKIWTKAAVDAGMPSGTTFHVLRHTYASILIRAGASVKVVQARLGHATAAETLDTYAHMWPEDEDRTRAAIDMALRGESGADVSALGAP